MPETVLIVEDEAYLAGLLSDVLQAAGYDVILTTASRAAERAVETVPSAIVMDYLMPGLNGQQVVERIRGVLPDNSPPVILVTGLSNARELARTVGADAYLRKPFDVDALVNLVDQFAKRRGP
ncbi:MAG: response regulator transcription factor [Chloroflexi bacterium]|nr:response regulator transcription factor [Chloroflexota bacterium]